ncbi:trypsin-like peptidase domain-containing protein [Mameliella alba]|uniref:trypsin-like peptidase domain-containing protein n=1 Tax=Mameliella alba TaxID=561184 RepID=UPI000B530345|nr:trypsin-like peptidase domain-containing protein [Mameliella alba]MBY6117962.1 trypsin-like peptidase domain-containing protein [Mameliella alba]OWV44295.1 hypothetical protein CDZ95_06305 [Mameliella alba]OWV63856.1 hypothetical protein CDZ97_12635 [Mameliella alba]
MTLPRLLATLLIVLAGHSASAFEGCKFSFRIDTQSSALQALIQGASERGGFWRPIAEAPDDVQEIARYIGRLDVCLMTPDGKPRTVTLNGQTRTLKSPQMTTCTAALLPGNRLLTNNHCFYNDVMVEAGFTFVQEARINFGYTAADFTGDVKTYAVSTREVARDEGLDAMVLQIFGADANEALGGHVPMVMQPRVRPRRALTMIHHPNGDPQQFSSGTCQVHPDQGKLPEAASQLRHSCETTGGSSGSLLLDARSLAVVGLHNQGGLHGRGGFNGGHKIAAVEAALGLGFHAEAAPAPVVIPKPDPETLAQEALTEALQLDGIEARRAALEALLIRYPESRVAQSARFTLDLLTPSRDPEAEAALALTKALALEGAAQRSVLEGLARDYTGTAAARRAEKILASMIPTPPAMDPSADRPEEPALPLLEYDNGILTFDDRLVLSEHRSVVSSLHQVRVKRVDAAGAKDLRLVKAGDRISHIDDERVSSTMEVYVKLWRLVRSGRESVTLTVPRNGYTVQAMLILSKSTSTAPLASTDDRKLKREGDYRFDGNRLYFGSLVFAGTRPVEVISAGETAPLRIGDQVVSVDGEPVRSVPAFYLKLRKASGQGKSNLRLRVARAGRAWSVTMPLGRLQP